MIYSYVILFSVYIFANANHIHTPDKLYVLDIEKLNNLQKENKFVDSFFHTKSFFDAIHSGKTTLQIVEQKNAIDSNATDSYLTMSKQVIHETTTTIELLENRKYFSLDNEIISSNIVSIDSDTILDCNSNNQKINDYYVGSTMSTHNYIKQNSNNGIQEGFIFSRQIKALETIKINEKTCKKVFTDLVHPLQIMNTKIVSNITFPYDRIIIPSISNGNRVLIDNSAFTSPDAPLLLCTDEKVLSKHGLIHKVGSGSTKIRGIPIEYSYALDTDGNECLYLAASVPGSINFNHGSGTNAIKRNIPLGNGITCTNCYAFIGASILADINIFGGKMSTFAFEAKDKGGAGFNLDILINNPTVSASKIVKLAGPGPVNSIPIAYGMALDVNFDGAWATVKGTGSAKGQASFSSGYTIVEEDYIMYARSKWTSKHLLINSNNIIPTYVNKGIFISTTSFSAIISLSSRIRYSFGGSIPIIGIGASVDFSTVLTATAQYVKWTKQYSLLLSMDNYFDGVDRNLLSNNRDNTYYPGDAIYFKLDYDGLNPNENHELYFNIHSMDDNNASSGTGYPIKMHKFKSSSSGRGTIKTHWKIPYDNKLMQNHYEPPNIIFSVHSSARLDRSYTSKKIRLLQRRNTISRPVFKYPKNNDVINVDEPIIISWDKREFTYFDYYKGTDGIGIDKSPDKVDLIIVSSDNNVAYQLANNIANTGTYRVEFPKLLLKNGNNFFLVIHDSKEYSKMAWQPGTFKLEPKYKNIRRQPTITKSHTSYLPITIVEPPNIAFGLPLWNNTKFFSHSNNSVQQHRVLASPNACPRAAISVLLQIEFGFDGFTLLGHTTSIGSAMSAPFIIIPQTNFCV